MRKTLKRRVGILLLQLRSHVEVALRRSDALRVDAESFVIGTRCNLGHWVAGGQDEITCALDGLADNHGSDQRITT
jgi:hypothetical protein